jgi:hypothetical protein
MKHVSFQMIPITIDEVHPWDDSVGYRRLDLSGYYQKQWTAHEMFEHIWQIVGVEQRIAEQREQLLESMYVGCRLQYRVTEGGKE